jgi:hypothetical protein
MPKKALSLPPSIIPSRDCKGVVRSLALTMALLLAGTALPAASEKPYPIFTPDSFVNSMKLAGRNFGAVNTAIANKDFETAKAQLVRTRELLAITITFWRDRHKDDATKILKSTLSKMDELDATLSRETIDGAQAGAIAKEIGAECQACHTIYREQDPQTKAYRWKAGAIQ